MPTHYLKLFYALLLLLLHSAASILAFNNSAQIKCIESEREALLNFKHGLIDVHDMLSTWRDDENSRDCCKWKGIQCHHQTAHVTILSLPGQYPTPYLRGAINITSLLSLQNIQHLDLSNNEFIGSQIPELMGSLTNLRYLNLSYCSFGGRIPAQLGNLTHLLSLILRGNFLSGELPYQLGSLTHLRYLDLNDNYLNGKLPYQLANLSQLRYLDLNDNYLNGKLPYQLANLSQLRYLDLSYNFFTGALPFQVGNLPFLHTLRLPGYFDVKPKDAHWLSNLRYLTNLAFHGLHNPDWLLTIIFPKLRELRLVDCSLSDTHTHSLFYSYSNFSTSLTILDLSYNMLTSSTFQLLSNFSSILHELYLSRNNIVLSSPVRSNFPSLVILDLSSNNMASLVFQGSFNFSSKLQNLYLQNCNLKDDSFLMSAFSITNSLSSLVSLDLSHNMLKSSSIFYWLFNFTTNLRTLDLHDNVLEGLIPDGCGKVMNSLEVLYLSSNKLQGEIPASLGHICTLKQLSLSYNNLSGEISSFIQNSSRCNSPVLDTLHLSNNMIIGKLPNLSAFTSLGSLSLSNNHLTGKIPESIGLLYRLQSLRLEGNYLEGDINELHFTNLSQLLELDLSDNSLSLTFDTSWIPPFQLFNLGLASCKLGPSFPSWLQSQSHLSFVDISDAGIDDFVPDWFWNKLQFIQELNMSYNSLQGTIPNLTMKSVEDGPDAIILNSNKLEGVIPTFLSHAGTLDLSENKFSDLNTLLCGDRVPKNRYSLDLSNNEIAGQLPDCWEHLSSLRYLDLRNNKLSGKIPQSMGSLVHLNALVLRNNNFIGELPLTLKNCSWLTLLDVSKNMLSGEVLSWIGESMQQLKILSLRVNRFFGSVPVHLCYLTQIQVLDLSRNNFSGQIPTCLTKFTTLIERSLIPREIVRRRKISSQGMYVDIYDAYVLLAWKGQDYEFWNPENLLKSIDLSSNNLTGAIPKEIGYLLGLVSMNLSRNYFHGEIPSEIGNLNSLEFLDLSRNEFSGNIPSTLSKIDRLGVLDLSNKNLSGRIPWGRQLQTFEASTFEGNIDLCGEQLNKSCPGDEAIPKPQQPAAIDGEEDNSVFYGALYMSLGIGFFAGFWGLLGPMLLWQPWRIAYMRFLNRLIDYILVMAELKIAKCQSWLRG